MLYHIDKQLGDFLDYLNSKIDPENLLVVLTADHGSHAIPEVAKEQGIDFARRIS